VRRRAVAVALALAAGAAGCGGDATPPTPAPRQADRWSGTDGSGVGATVDFAGFDATTPRIEAALRREDRTAAVAIVSVVNRGEESVPAPRFWAVVPGDVQVALTPAEREVVDGRVRGRAATGTIAADGAATLYLLFPGSVADVRGVTMSAGGRRSVSLRRETLPGP
jgi:hypothetical protein